MSPEDVINRAAREVALQALQDFRPRATAVVELASRGRVLVVGGAAAWTLARRMVEPLRPRVIGRAPRPETHADTPGLQLAADAELHLSGHLGAFRLSVSSGGEDSVHEADLVLDLDQPPLVQGRLAPPGYLRGGDDPGTWEDLLAGLADLVGVFEKPTYFQYDPDICAHRRNGITACTRCIDACPTEAILSIGERVEVDPNLCQGLGSCATACPSGAIRYNYPAPGDALQLLRRLLDGYRAAGGQRPRLLLHDDAGGAEWVSRVAERLPGNLIPFALEDVASLGLEAWLCALAMGAADLSLLATPATPDKVRRLLAEQIAIAGALLEGMGYDAARVRLLDPVAAEEPLTALAAETPDAAVPPATFALSDEKRAMAFWALDHLQAHAPALRPLVNLPAGAPFGGADVSARACTLCLSCVSACPGHALQDGYDKPELRFIEANCLQCGMCTRVCPENAIWITPRFLFDAEARRRPRVLHQEAPFECIGCGKPFATRSVIERMMGRLQGHHMFRDERALRRLQMCEDCRVMDIAQDPEAMAMGAGRHGHQ